MQMAQVKLEPGVFKKPHGPVKWSRLNQTGEKGWRTGPAGHEKVTIKMVHFTQCGKKEDIGRFGAATQSDLILMF